MRARGEPPKHNTVKCRVCGRPMDVIAGTWLRYLRIRSGISLRGFAHKVQCSPAYISDVERDNRRVPEWLYSHYAKLVDGRREN